MFFFIPNVFIYAVAYTAKSIHGSACMCIHCGCVYSLGISREDLLTSV